jgi:hypothetical protein
VSGVSTSPKAMPLDVKQTLVAALASTQAAVDAAGGDDKATEAIERAMRWVREQPCRVDPSWFPPSAANDNGG